jgi:multiple sugar transport system permease protein
MRASEQMVPESGAAPSREARPRAVSGSARRTRERRPTLSYQRQNALFLVPYLLGTLVLVVVPALMTLAVSFADYHGIRPPTWVGLENFRRLAEAPLVRVGLYNTLIFAAAAVPLRLLGALGLALLLGGRGRGVGSARVAAFLPTVLPEVAYALVWLWILNPVSGPLNVMLGALGLPAPAWMTQDGTARLAIVLMALLQVGEGFVLLLVARQTVPASVYEAAEVDGANRWQGFWRITLPLIMPWILLLLCRDLIVSVQNTFTSSFVLAYGGPNYATTFLPLLIYELSFDFLDWGLASAVLVVVYAWILLLIWGSRNLIEGLRRREALDEG